MYPLNPLSQALIAACLLHQHPNTLQTSSLPIALQVLIPITKFLFLNSFEATLESQPHIPRDAPMVEAWIRVVRNAVHGDCVA